MSNPLTQIGDSKKLLTVLAVVAVVVVVVMFGKKFSDAIGKIFESVGLNDSKEERAADAVINTASELENRRGTKSPFSPLFYDTTEARAKKAKIFTLAAAKAIAKKIYDSVGIVFDTPAQTVSAIKNCKTQSQVSFLSKVFSDTYGKDLLTWLTEKLDTETQKINLSQILKYVSNLPKYNP